MPDSPVAQPTKKQPLQESQEIDCLLKETVQTLLTSQGSSMERRDFLADRGKSARRNAL